MTNDQNTRRRPYIGVTGFTHHDEVTEAVTLWRQAWGGGEPTHDLMIGVLASTKTLRGSSSKCPRRYPQIGDIPHIFTSAGGVLNLVHYAGDRPPESEELFRLHEAVGRQCHGFQFDWTWPERIDLVNLFGHVGRRRAVLQIGPRDVAALAEHDRASIERLGRRLRPYVDGAFPGNNGETLATDLLLDIGRGIVIDEARAEAIVRRVAEAQLGDDMCLGVAGGLCAETLTPGIGVLLRAGCSIDAEGRLRDDADGGGELDLVKVGDYLRAAVALLTPQSDTQ